VHVHGIQPRLHDIGLLELRASAGLEHGQAGCELCRAGIVSAKRGPSLPLARYLPSERHAADCLRVSLEAEELLGGLVSQTFRVPSKAPLATRSPSAASDEIQGSQASHGFRFGRIDSRYPCASVRHTDVVG
jgi:hypothetical protein